MSAGDCQHCGMPRIDFTKVSMWEFTAEELVDHFDMGSPTPTETCTYLITLNDEGREEIARAAHQIFEDNMAIPEAYDDALWAAVEEHRKRGRSNAP